MGHGFKYICVSIIFKLVSPALCSSCFSRLAHLKPLGSFDTHFRLNLVIVKPLIYFFLPNLFLTKLLHLNKWHTVDPAVQARNVKVILDNLLFLSPPISAPSVRYIIVSILWNNLPNLSSLYLLH